MQHRNVKGEGPFAYHFSCPIFTTSMQVSIEKRLCIFESLLCYSDWQQIVFQATIRRGPKAVQTIEKGASGIVEKLQKDHRKQPQEAWERPKRLPKRANRRPEAPPSGPKWGQMLLQGRPRTSREAANVQKRSQKVSKMVWRTFWWQQLQKQPKLANDDHINTKFVLQITNKKVDQISGFKRAEAPPKARMMKKISKGALKNTQVE